MYLDHYQLVRMPFEISPDPQFLWLGEKHQEAFAILQYGVVENKGFIVLIGEPGTGKSTLLNAISGNFGPTIRFAKIADPAMSEMDFFNFAANAFEMGRTFDNKADFLIHLQEFVRNTGARSGKVVLVIDEAQRLTPELLEQIRILSNFDGPDQKAIRCIFAGQNEFLGMLKQNRALSQRIFFSHILQPLTEAETEAYIVHRLTVAGAKKPVFKPSAMRAVGKLAGGNPRLINIICDHALLSGYASFLKVIGPNIIRKCAEETLIQREAVPEPGVTQGAGALLTEVESKEDDAVTATEVEPKEADAVTAADPIRRPRASMPGVSNHTATYWALAAVAILAAVAYGHFSGAFHTRFDSYANDQEELSIAKSRVAQLESAVDLRDKDLATASQKLVELEKALANEKSDKNRLNAATSRPDLQGEMEAVKNENSRLQAQLIEVSNQKDAAEARLGEAQMQDAWNVTDAKEVKIARDRVAQLEAALSELEKKQSQLKQKLGEYERALAKEKGPELTPDLRNSQNANVRLQSQLQGLKAPKPASPPVSSEKSSGGIDPAKVIDFVIQKKSQ